MTQSAKPVRVPEEETADSVLVIHIRSSGFVPRLQLQPAGNGAGPLLSRQAAASHLACWVRPPLRSKAPRPPAASSA